MSHDPEWLNSAHDDKHRLDSAPLLGQGGDLSLQDPEDPSQQQDSSTKQDYGSSSITATNLKDTAKGKGGGIKATVEVPKGSAGGGGGGGKYKDDASAVTHDSKSVLSQMAAKPHVPPINPCLWIFNLLAGIAALTSAALLVAQLLPLLMASGQQEQHTAILGAILKVYLACICLAFVIVETELPVPFVSNSPLLQNFWSRGFIYSFVGLVCTTEAYSERVDDLITHSSERFYIGWAPVFMQVVATLMLAVGVVYMLLGLCCLRRFREKLKQKEKELWQKYREDMRTWRRQHDD